MISRDVAETLVWRWSLVELEEILSIGYPEVSSGFVPEAPDRKTIRRGGPVTPRSIDAAGAAMMRLKAQYPNAYKVLRWRYIDGKPVDRTLVAAALDRFSHVYQPPK